MSRFVQRVMLVGAVLTATGATVLGTTTLGVPSASAVAGGSEITDGHAPQWLVTIASQGSGLLPQRAFCGGTLISPTRVVTAAHCLDQTDPNDLEIHIGGSTLSRDPGRIVAVRGFATHPRYRIIRSHVAPADFGHAAVAHDVALIELAEPVRGVPVLPVAAQPATPGRTVQVFGHGITGPAVGGAYPPGDSVHTARLRVISDSTCDGALDGLVNGPTVVCAQSSRATVCSGDSGGPLVIHTRLGLRLAGVTSFAGEVIDKTCGQPYANGFADAGALRRWLTQPVPILAPMPTGPPAISGTRTSGATLTCQPPAWTQTPTVMTYAWFRQQTEDGFDFYAPIEDQTTATLTLTDDLATSPIQCVIDARTAGGKVSLYSQVR